MWEIIKWYISQIQIEGKIHRFFLIEFLDNHLSKRWSITTMDCYRNNLEKAGYLKKGPKPGVYIKVKPIPYDLTSSQLRREYDEMLMVKFNQENYENI